MSRKLTAKRLIRGAIRKTQTLLEDPDRKPLPQIVYEAARWGIKHRHFPQNYLTYPLYRKSIENADDYLSHPEYLRLSKQVEEPALYPFFDDKVLFQYHFAGSSIPLPQFLGYNVGSRFFKPDDTQVSIGKFDHFDSLLDELIVHSHTSAVFVKLAQVGKKGLGTFLLEAGGRPEDLCRDLHRAATSGSYIYQQALNQHPEVSAIYPNSINTLRIATCAFSDGEIWVVSALMRLGAGGRYVDNASQGGLFIGIDMDSGTFTAPAHTFHSMGAGVYYQHPDTGLSFEGYRVPYFEEALDLARAAAAHLPYRFVGWDVAITESGPVLIEGNKKFHVGMSDIAARGLKKNHAFSAFYNEIVSGS